MTKGVEYQHEKGRRVADPANRVTQEVSEETELAAGTNLTPSLHVFYSQTIFVWIELSYHYICHHHLHVHVHFVF